MENIKLALKTIEQFKPENYWLKTKTIIERSYEVKKTNWTFPCSCWAMEISCVDISSNSFILYLAI